MCRYTCIVVKLETPRVWVNASQFWHCGLEYRIVCAGLPIVRMCDCVVQRRLSLPCKPSCDRWGKSMVSRVHLQHQCEYFCNIHNSHMPMQSISWIVSASRLSVVIAPYRNTYQSPKVKHADSTYRCLAAQQSRVGSRTRHFCAFCSCISQSELSCMGIPSRWPPAVSVADFQLHPPVVTPIPRLSSRSSRRVMIAVVSYIGLLSNWSLDIIRIFAWVS